MDCVGWREEGRCWRRWRRFLLWSVGRGRGVKKGEAKVTVRVTVKQYLVVVERAVTESHQRSL